MQSSCEANIPACPPPQARLISSLLRCFLSRLQRRRLIKQRQPSRKPSTRPDAHVDAAEDNQRRLQLLKDAPPGSDRPDWPVTYRRGRGGGEVEQTWRPEISSGKKRNEKKNGHLSLRYSCREEKKRGMHEILISWKVQTQAGKPQYC